MARFLIIAVVFIYIALMVLRLVAGQRLSSLDWIGLFLALAATGSMVYYILTTN